MALPSATHETHPAGACGPCAPSARWSRGHAAALERRRGGHGGGRGATGWTVGRVGACAGACVRVDLPGWCARRAPGAAECVVGTVGSTCGVVGAAVTAQGTYKPGGTQKSVGHGHPGVVQAPRTRRSRPPAPGSSGKSHQILPSRRRSRVTMRPRPGCASPRHPPRGAPQPGVGQPVGGARTALVFRGLQNTFRDQQAGPSPQGRVPAMRGAVHHVSSRGGPGLHAQHVRPASARQARTAAARQTAIGRWLCRGGSNGPSDQTDQGMRIGSRRRPRKQGAVVPGR